MFREPTPVEEALRFCAALRSTGNASALVPAERHWSIFADLCRQTEARGNP